jgi:hypothetical protein
VRNARPAVNAPCGAFLRHFWAQKGAELPCCATFLLQKGAGIAAMAKNSDSTAAYAKHTRAQK